MFDIGFPELMLAAVVALLVLGPERLPGALRSLGLMLGRLRRSYTHVKTEIEKEIGMDEIRRQLHNEQIMEDVERMRREVDSIGQELKQPTFLDDNPIANPDSNGGASASADTSGADAPSDPAPPTSSRDEGASSPPDNPAEKPAEKP